MNDELEFESVKRELGEGKWDKALKKKMVELSVADNYDEAKEEWLATGEVFWSDFHVQREDIPEWINNSQMGYGKCLCGHIVKYHFQITNTENGVVECVGSDHINSYLIMRQLSQELNLPIDMITDELIQEWINVRMRKMKAESWWANQGQAFTMMFDAVKEMDLHFNVHSKGDRYYDAEIREYRPVTTIRKRAEGKYGSPEYKMASIVWRWNHPNNPKNQQTVHGFPNDNLMKDLALFYIKSTQLALDFIKEKNRIEEKKAMVAREKQEIIEQRLKKENERKQRMLERQRYLNSPEYKEKLRVEQERNERLMRIREEERKIQLEKEKEEYKNILRKESRTFRFACAQFNMPMFNESWATQSLHLRKLAFIKTKMEERKALSEEDIGFLHSRYEAVKPTEKQLKYLKDLGYDEKVKTKFEASELINKLIGENQQGEGHPV